jgi:cell wall-associated NlpC family hydrolase
MPATSRVARTAGFGVLLLTLVTTALAGLLVAGTPSASAMTRTLRVTNGFDIVRHQEGDPYQYGAAGPGRFDCSGLVYYSFRKAGFRHIPRSSSAQARQMNRIPKSQLHKGDLVFFYNGAARSSNVYHVGVFAGWRHGHRTIIHAPRPGERVHRERIWTSRWFAGTLRGN